ncbi:MAG: hypothetical protein EA424_05495 [Planctomycetaceae bacterium]|nr:MAG: hypothetical protein EA424_05495 [Planctomycetaceae bacterium]
MPLDAQHELPSDRNAWACLAADSGQPQEVRDRAWEQLFPVIQRIGRQIASRFRGHPFDDLAAESAAIIWARIQQFQPERGDFENWCRTVLQHHAIDVWRKQERNPVQPAVGGQEKCLALHSATIDDAQEGSEAAEARCRQLRSVLNRIAWPRSRAVDYFAVLLLQLRLAAARHFTQDPLSQDRAWRSELSAHVEWLLPWSPDEQQARLKSDWPPLATLWQAVSMGLGNPAVKIDAQLICRTVEPLLPAATQLTPDLWNHWVHRAKERARHEVQNPAVWEQCFCRLLPDYQRGDSS